MLANSHHGSALNQHRVAFVHGFTQTRESWTPIIHRLPKEFHYISIDAPGHGESPLTTGDLEQTASELIDTVGSTVWCGYSMGARMCLFAALAYPSNVKGLVLISGTAGIEDDTERLQRQESDRQLARHIVDVGVDMFVDEWLAQPMFSNLPVDEADRTVRKSNTSRGLANNLLTTGVGSQRPVWDRLAEIRIPVLIIAGALDTKFMNIAERLHRELVHSQLEIVSEAGHTVHYEQPQIVADLIGTWLATHFAN